MILKELHRIIRVGGLVKKDSVMMDNNKINFIITDFKNELYVTFSPKVLSNKIPSAGTSTRKTKLVDTKIIEHLYRLF